MINNLFFIISIVFIIYYIYICQNNIQNNNIQNNNIEHNQVQELLPYFNGYWLSTEEFNTCSDVDKLLLYVDYENTNLKLIIIKNNNILIDNNYNFYIDECNLQYKNNILSLDLQINNNIKDNLIWNNKEFKIYINILTGELKIIDIKNDILYGDFIKDNQITKYLNIN